jgi:hypothetical protein
MSWASDLLKYSVKVLNNSFSLLICILSGTLGCIIYFSDDNGYIKDYRILHNLDHTLAKLVLVFLLCFIISMIVVLIMSKSFNLSKHFVVQFKEKQHANTSRKLLDKRLQEDFELFWQCLIQNEKKSIYKLATKKNPIIMQKSIRNFYIDIALSQETVFQLSTRQYANLREGLPNNRAAIELTPKFKDWVRSHDKASPKCVHQDEVEIDRTV